MSEPGAAGRALPQDAGQRTSSRSSSISGSLMVAPAFERRSSAEEGRRDILAARGRLNLTKRGVQRRSPLLATENWIESHQPIESLSGAEKEIGSIRAQVHAASPSFQSALLSIGCAWIS